MVVPLSSSLISGIFVLSEGTRHQYYNSYRSAIEFAHLTDNAGLLGVTVWDRTPRAPLYDSEDCPLVFLLAKAAFPANEEGILDAVHIASFVTPILDSIPPPTTGQIAHIVGIITSVDDDPSGIRTFAVEAVQLLCSERYCFTTRFVCLFICFIIHTHMPNL